MCSLNTLVCFQRRRFRHRKSVSEQNRNCVISSLQEKKKIKKHSSSLLHWGLLINLTCLRLYNLHILLWTFWGVSLTQFYLHFTVQCSMTWQRNKCNYSLMFKKLCTKAGRDNTTFWASICKRIYIWFTSCKMMQKPTEGEQKKYQINRAKYYSVKYHKKCTNFKHISINKTKHALNKKTSMPFFDY